MKKQLPDSMYNVPAVEHWLEDMAAKGWRCVGFCGAKFAKFEESGPETVRYRLEPRLGNRPKEPDEETAELYGGMGWAYVDSSYGNDFYLWRAIRPDARELFTDPGSEDLAFAWLDRIQRRNLLWSLVIDAFFLMLVLLTYGDKGLWKLAYMGASALPLYLYPVVWNTGAYWMDRRALKKLRRSLAAGFPREHDAPYGARQRADRVCWAVAAVICMLMLGSVFWNEPVSLDGVPEDLPVVTLEQLGTDIPREKGDTERWHNFLVSDAAYVWESGWRKYPAWYRGYSEYYDLRAAWLAGPMLRAVAHQQKWVLEPLADDRFDEARYCEKDGDQYLLVRKDSRVLLFRGQVPVDLREHLEDFAAALAEFQ